jgi:hypothetical protein
MDPGLSSNVLSFVTSDSLLSSKGAVLALAVVSHTKIQKPTKLAMMNSALLIANALEPSN